MMNPFTQANTEPIDGMAATVGQTGYTCIRTIGSLCDGYSITGFGENGAVIIELRYVP